MQSPRGHAVEAAIKAAEQGARAAADVRQALSHELEEARNEASVAARRYEVVDPAKRLVARELEARWNAALERVAHLEERLKKHDAAALRPKIDRVALMSLAHDLLPFGMRPAPTRELTSGSALILIREVLIDLDDTMNAPRGWRLTRTVLRHEALRRCPGRDVRAIDVRKQGTRVLVGEKLGQKLACHLGLKLQIERRLSRQPIVTDPN